MDEDFESLSVSENEEESPGPNDSTSNALTHGAHLYSIRPNVRSREIQKRIEGWFAVHKFDHTGPLASADIYGEGTVHRPETIDDANWTFGIYPIPGYDDAWYESWEPSSGRIHYKPFKGDPRNKLRNIPPGSTCALDWNEHNVPMPLIERFVYAVPQRRSYPYLKDALGRKVLSPWKTYLRHIPSLPLECVEQDFNGVAITSLIMEDVLYTQLVARIKPEINVFAGRAALDNPPERTKRGQRTDKSENKRAKWQKLSVAERRVKLHTDEYARTSNKINMRAQRWRMENGGLRSPRVNDRLNSILTVKTVIRVYRNAPTNFLWNVCKEVYWDRRNNELVLKVTDKPNFKPVSTDRNLTPGEVSEAVANYIEVVGGDVPRLDDYEDVRTIQVQLPPLTQGNRYVPCLRRRAGLRELKRLSEDAADEYRKNSKRKQPDSESDDEGPNAEPPKTACQHGASSSAPKTQGQAITSYAVSHIKRSDDNVAAKGVRMTQTSEPSDRNFSADDFPHSRPNRAFNSDPSTVLHKAGLEGRRETLNTGLGQMVDYEDVTDASMFTASLQHRAAALDTSPLVPQARTQSVGPVSAARSSQVRAFGYLQGGGYQPLQRIFHPAEIEILTGPRSYHPSYSLGHNFMPQESMLGAQDVGHSGNVIHRLPSQGEVFKSEADGLDDLAMEDWETVENTHGSGMTWPYD